MKSPVLKALFPLLGLLLALGAPAYPGGRAEKTKSLAAVEVREYQGKDLSSIADFRENSIKGPQQVDRAAYRLRVDGLVRTPLDYTYDQVLARDRYRKVVTLNGVEGWSVASRSSWSPRTSGGTSGSSGSPASSSPPGKTTGGTGRAGGTATRAT